MKLAGVNIDNLGSKCLVLIMGLLQEWSSIGRAPEATFEINRLFQTIAPRYVISLEHWHWAVDAREVPSWRVVELSIGDAFGLQFEGLVIMGPATGARAEIRDCLIVC